ncbi:MAG: hypothetical protein J6K12_05695 [Clostridia bacterium]|nr:hypothetical protein [Clostridia bacterium]
MIKNRRILVLVCGLFVLLVLLLGLAGFIYISSVAPGPKIIGITENQAVAIAAKSLGLDSKDITLYKCELDRDGFDSKYELELMADGRIFEIDISAKDGRILNIDS